MNKKFLGMIAVCVAALALTACAKKHTHDPVKVEAVAESCTEDGSHAYYECSGCGEVFADKACKEKTSCQRQLIPGGHIYGAACDTTCDREGCEERREPDVQHTDGDGNGACDTCQEAIGYLYDNETDTYTAYTAEGLYKWSETAQNGANLILAADITMPETLNLDSNGDGTMDSNWYLHMTRGNITGNGHSITGLVVIGDSMYAGGLAGRLDNGAVIQDLHLRDVQVAGIGTTGGIVGCISDGSVIGCSVTGTVKNEMNSPVGGIAGLIGYKSFVIGCRNYAQIIGVGTVAGITGNVTTGGNVIACINAGCISGGGSYGASLGGIVARNSGTVSACYSAAGMKVESNEVCYTGGVVAYGTSGVLIENFWTAPGASPANGNGRAANDIDAKKVDGQSVTWETAMGLMNEVLANGEIHWKYEKNTGTDADSIPLIPVAW